MLFWRLISRPLLPELPFPELTTVIAFSFNIESGRYGLCYETKLFCSDSSSGQRPRRTFVLSHFLDGGTRRWSGGALLFFNRALCLQTHPLTRGFLSGFLALTSEASVLGRGSCPGPDNRDLSRVVLGLLYNPGEAR